MLSVARCVVDTFEDAGAVDFLGVIWAQGGDPDVAPLIRLREHSWTDPVSIASYSVYAVHTASASQDATWNEYPADDGYAALAVPCYRRHNVTDDEMTAMNTPTGTAWRANKPGKLPATWVLGDGAAPYWGGDRHEVVTSRFATLESPSSKSYESAGANTTLQILLDSHFLQGKRIPYESLDFQTALSKGASGDVWVCAFNGQTVAAKRLLRDKNQKLEKVQSFAEEIELTASLTHPHIVEFVGVAWNSLSNLVMLLEYVPRGSLQCDVHTNADLLSWARDKIYMAVGVAQALAYLHGHASPLIHRYLKSTNILLTSKLEPKLIDFGVSRGTVDLTMTAGVGTAYWTAPEILEGKRYTERADIYSFGVVLTELDTGRIPYFDALTQGGGRLKPVQVLQSVVTGELQPSFTGDCPPRIQRIGSACLAYDPSRRPTAQQLVRELEGGDSN
ncbi:hypothetical protein PHYPSEUDO_002197 [Phytophthora pseudosyringae]|uniref:Protein kinase domain-containing protein n=1 Tax=Phytophthora pseudosyringae TaxID=221518 RepID=A0A8T1VUB7_9STRA|nr:hypothetical protein PHYPSEUDO_002197 [Phytophthora pseudosyringae]